MTPIFPFRFLARPLILMYHAVEDTADDPYAICVSPARFADQMASLADHGWRGVGVTELLAAEESERLVGLTFDDGYASLLDAALPVLQRHGFGGTVYPVAGAPGGRNDWDQLGPRRPLLDRGQVRELAAAGLEIGSHGMSHRSCPQLGDAELAREVGGSREVLEDLVQGPVQSFCYPFGHLDARSVAAVRAAGYASAVGIGSYAGRDIYQLPRIYVGERDGMLRLHVKRLRHAWRQRVGRSVMQP